MLVLSIVVRDLTERANRSLDFQIIGEMPQIRNVQRKAVALAAYQILRRNDNTERQMRKVTHELDDLMDMIWCSTRTIFGMVGIGHQIESTHLAIILGVGALREDITKTAHHIQSTTDGEEAVAKIDGEKTTMSTGEGDSSLFRAARLSLNTWGRGCSPFAGISIY